MTPRPSSPGSIGTLKLGAIEYEVPASLNPSRLPRSKALLDIRDPANVDNLHFMLQKYLLGQDVFLVSQPGPYARRLALTFASIINAEYEYIALHRDVGETELKQGREIREGGNLVYVDSPAVNAAKHGRLLILEGIEKAERGIMPVLNNLLENREMNLDDGTHIIHPHRYALLDTTTNFIPAHKNFRVIAIAAPVPPYPGYPLDPPFRSCFQARFMDPVGAMVSLSNTVDSKTIPLYTQIRDIILSTQYSSESRHALETVSKSVLPPFPQTTLLKLRVLLSLFPPPEQITPSQLGQLFLMLHPTLIHAPFQAWALLSAQTEDSGLGLLGYRLVSLKRTGENTADATFDGPQRVACNVPAGPKALLEYPLTEAPNLHVTERFVGLLTCFMQAHALGWDVSLIPPAQPSTASTSTSTLVNVFGRMLGYEMEAVHMYKELGGRELVMRRKIQNGGATTWEPSPIIEAAWNGRMVHLSGLDILGSTAGSLSRLLQDRETELWEGKRIVSEASQEEIDSGELIVSKPSFRVISTASKSIPLKDWLTEEHANMFFPIPSQPMSVEEEALILRGTGCAPTYVETLLSFADKYRRSISADNVQKHRNQRLAMFPEDHDLHAIISNSLLADFLPATERMNLDALLDEADIQKMTEKFHPSPLVIDGSLYFPASTSAGTKTNPTPVPLFDPSQDRAGVESLVPHMDHFYDNSLQTGLMRDLAIDLELMREHVVLLGNQGVGKNKILLGRPREYIQLHRDTTVNQLMFTTSLEAGVLKFTDSPLLRAITFGRVIIIDEADKAPEHVVAIFRKRDNDIVVHPNFRLVLLANRPGYPFLGNHFLQVLGENFSPHSVPNPDQASERKLLEQLAPELPEDVIHRLVGAFQDLRVGYENGSLGYPYSLRELINLVQHMQAYPTDALGDALRNVFDFDIYKPETIDKLGEILKKHGLTVPHLGLDAARESAKKIQDIQFEPKETDLSGPKEGKHDNEEHSGGNTYAGGTGGRDTVGMGGRGGYKRLWKGGDIKQVPDALKDDVPEHIKEKAREMAKQELQRRLEELDMNIHEARGYGEIIRNTQAHMASLYDLLEHLAAKEEERVWVKRQTDGELDDTRLTEGLTGEATVYKRRGMEKPELGRPQIKPKRIRFIFDLSASMYRFQYDGRLKRSLETAAMLMETFDRLSRKDKYVWDVILSPGDGPEIPLVEIDKPPVDLRDRWKIIEKMDMIPQYAFAGDYTVEAIQKGVQEVGKFDADDWFVIAITDANFGRYNITPEELSRAMKRNPKVHTALICIGEGAEAPWISKQLPGQGFRVANTSDIPTVLRSILSTMIDHA
ncbi:AAA domain-containing protein [Armillaria borealis]|uniref:AAA domain-containing protein n=1 Tax=Armillaria borealis TaxID=47425 RepID=A0AA39MYS3_9AGAR|nr:AAA domain-containing protein [Armillaria borealis]